MPGTIQVSVLELVGFPSLLQSSPLSIKVSMGKQAQEIQDKGDYSFSLASFRDKLSVSVHDSEGNEIAHTGVETRSIVEKGIWDDSFPLQGGGHVRMRLCFILSEDELNKIRSMRESATRKKKRDLLKRSSSSSDLAVASGDARKITHQTEERNVTISVRQANKISAGSSAKVLSRLPAGQRKQVFSTSKSTGALDKLPAYQQVRDAIEARHGEKRNQVDKTPSSVRNMILALESSPVKEALPATNKTMTTTRLSSNTTADIPSEVPSSKKTAAVHAKPVLSKSKIVATPIQEEIGSERGIVGDLETICEDILLQKTQHCRESEVKTNYQMSNEKNFPKMLIAKEESEEETEHPKKLHSSTTPEERKFSWKTIFQDLPRRNKISIYSLREKQVSTSYDSRVVLEKYWKSKHWISSQHRETPKMPNRNECYTSDSLHGWKFLEEMIRLCVPTDDRPFIDQLEGGFSYRSPDTTQEVLDTRAWMNNDEKSSVEQKASESSRRPDNRAPMRPVGQVMKIGIMVGFGVLVLLTRQRN